MYASSALALLCTIAVAVAVALPGDTYGTGGSAPKGWNDKVENFCSGPTVLECCQSVVVGAGGLDDATCNDYVNAMAGGQKVLAYGYCPKKYLPLCCAVVVDSTTATGCGPATQVGEPK